MTANIPTPTSRTRTRLLAVALVSVSGLVALAGCGSSSSSNSTSTTSTTPPATTASTSSTPASGSTGSSSGGQKLSLEANKEGQLEYSTKALSAKAGAVTIAFTNMASLMHNVTVESASGEKVGQTETFSGGTKDLSLTLKAGTYKFYCSVPGHRQAGMEGTLTVQ